VTNLHVKTLAVLSSPPLLRPESVWSTLSTIWVPGQHIRPPAVEACLDIYRPDNVLLDERLAGVWKPYLSGVKTKVVRTAEPANAQGIVLFYCQSDTIVRSLSPIAGCLPSELRPKFLIPYCSAEGAGPTLRNLGMEARQDLLRSLAGRSVRVLVLANDWGPDARFLISAARLRGLPTVCLQESVIDFDDQNSGRMRQADHALLQGPATLLKLSRSSCWLTGNPRYETLEPCPRPNPGRVLVNCNFTYGIQTSHRDAWLGMCADVLRSSALDYLIAQHPRDKADISRFGRIVRTSSAIIHDVLRECSAVVSRFSSVLHEGIALGRPGIYFNPHGEHVGYDYEPDGVILMRADSTEQLKDCIIRSHSDRALNAETLRIGLFSYMSRHMRPFEESPRQLSASAITRIATGLYTGSGRRDDLWWRLRCIKFALLSLMSRKNQ
jgi:hypothetical protein